MSSRIQHILFCIVVVLFAAGCSTQKDAFLNRSYHQLTARDNGWFNANELLKETVAGIRDSYVDNYDEVLPIFVYGTEQQAKNAYPDLDKCIEKCSVVIDRHSMQIKKDEKNRWIDDAYFVIGKSDFYKQKYLDAERSLAYVSKRFKGADKQHQGSIWLARTYIQLGRFAKAQTALNTIKEEKELPKNFPHDELSAVQADLYLKKGQVDNAIVELERAVDISKRKQERVRWAFILAQLYEMKGKSEQAIKQFAKVTRMNPPYELAFHAQIFQALAFDQRGASKQIRGRLNRMLKDDKHVDHYDMIYYAIADIDFKERLKDDGIAHLKTSCAVSTTDTKQKTKSFLRLADIYFDDRNYEDAQLYYDSTSAIIAEEHVRYEEVRTKAEVLGELIEQLNIIAREDSLQRLAAMDEGEREKVIAKLIKEREQAEADRARKAEEAREQALEVTTAKPTTPTAPGGKGNWYFYNPSQVSRGFSEFRKRWGNRVLEDDWRRSDRSGTAFAQDEEGEVKPDEEVVAEKGDEPWKDPSTYLADIPTSEADLLASNEKVCAAFYRAGIIYKEKLKDDDNAIESFEVLNDRFDECRYTPESFYQLYRIYLEKETQKGYFGETGSEFYKNVIMNRYPNSEFARLIEDPGSLHSDSLRRQQESDAYAEAYAQFRRRAYPDVISTCNDVIQNEERNHLIRKYYMLRAMSIGGMSDLSGLRNALEEIKAKFPGTEEEQAAMDLLAALDQTSQQQETPKEDDPKASAYRADAGQHYFALIFPNNEGDLNTIKVKISDFNRLFFRNTNIQITSSFLDADNQVVLMSLFENKDKAMEYYSLFSSNKEQLKGVNDMNFVFFAIAPDNYAQMYRSKDVAGYAAFFGKNYLN